MESTAYGLVILAALLHALWNVMVKASSDDRFVMGMLLMTPGMVVAIPLLFVVPGLSAEAWIYMAGSLVFHVTYYAFLVLAFRLGDLSQVYPIARGSAPLLLALVAYVLAGEVLSPLALTGVVVLSAGITALSWRWSADPLADPKALAAAAATAVFIAAYTYVDALGARAAVSPESFIVWFAFLQGATFVLTTLAVRRRRWWAAVRPQLWRGLGGGVIAAASYSIMLWALTMGPIAVMAALRETSVLFVVAMSGVYLKEPLGFRRIMAATAIVAGAALLRF